MFQFSRVASCLAVAGGLLFAQPASAAICSASPPPPGAVIKGPVLHVEDGETLCIGTGFEPSKWVPLKVADAAGEAIPKSALMAAAFGKDAVCRVTAVADGQAVASCTIEARPLAMLLRRPEVLKAAGEWR